MRTKKEELTSNSQTQGCSQISLFQKTHPDLSCLFLHCHKWFDIPLLKFSPKTMTLKEIWLLEGTILIFLLKKNIHVSQFFFLALEIIFFYGLSRIYDLTPTTAGYYPLSTHKLLFFATVFPISAFGLKQQ